MDKLNPIGIVTDQVKALTKSAIALTPNLIAAVVIVLLTALIAFVVRKIVSKVMTRARSRPSLRAAIVKLSSILVWILGILIAATVLFPGLTPAKLLAGLGLGSIAVGLAFKDIFENFLAGFLILLRQPMRIGDDIACEGLRGRVENISIRDTFLRKRSGELILVPNSYLYKNPVEILTDRNHRRIGVVVGVAYGADLDRARDVMKAAVEGLGSVICDRPVEVFAKEFNASSIDFLVRWWTKSAPVDEHRSRDEAVAAIKAALDDVGIEIPFPYRTLTFKEPLPLRKADGNDADPDIGADARQA